MTAAWRRAAGWSWPSSEGPCSPGKGYWSFDERWGGSQGGGWPGSVALRCPHRPDQPAGACPERARVTRPVANDRARPPAAANPGRQGAGPLARRRPAQRRRPLPGSGGRPSPCPDGTLGLSGSGLAQAKPKPTPCLWSGPHLCPRLGGRQVNLIEQSQRHPGRGEEGLKGPRRPFGIGQPQPPKLSY